MRLETKYHKWVIEIYKNNMLPRYRYKKKCKICDGEGYTGTDSQNRLIVCSRCVNTVKAREDWEEFKTANNLIGL